MITPVLLCGGAGTRLWPISRKSYPKQFARILQNDSLFQTTLIRLSGPEFSSPVIVTSDEFRFIVTEQMAAIEISAQAILIEPKGRNTTPAVLAAALEVQKHDPNGLLLVAPTDHSIADPEKFKATVLTAVECAKAGNIVTFGIDPTRAETGYGYMELGPDFDPTQKTPQRLVRFLEKPDKAMAENMIIAGHYLWNSGIFLMSVPTVLKAFQTHAFDIYAQVMMAYHEAKEDLGFTRLQPNAWEKVPDISFDYAIMEKISNVDVMPYKGAWSDLGSWNAIWEEAVPDRLGNVATQNTTAIECRNTLLMSNTNQVEVVGLGLDNLIVVATTDAILVADKTHAQDVKTAVQTLREKNVQQANELPIPIVLGDSMKPSGQGTDFR